MVSARCVLPPSRSPLCPPPETAHLLPPTLSMACLLALKRHEDCLSLVTKEVNQGTTNADIYILRARLHNFFQKVEQGGQGRCRPPRLQEEARLSASSRVPSPQCTAALSSLAEA